MVDGKKTNEHELSLNGVSGFVMFVRNKGQEITVSGWCDRHRKWRNGDRIMLCREAGEKTRYRIINIRRPGNPPDQYFMDMAFDPR